MNKPLTLVIVFMLLTLAACANAATKNSNKVINPGDKIGDFIIETGSTGEEITYMTFVHCPVQGNTETCTLPVGTKVNVSNSFFASPASGMSLDEVWAIHTYEMTIEDHPVNLEAFGFIDVTHPLAGTLRNWNVTITSDKPGKATVNFKSVLNNEPYQGTFVVIFE